RQGDWLVHEERPQARTTLSHPGLELRTLIDSVKDYAIFSLTPDGRVASWNTGAQAIKGYSEPEVLGRHVSLFYTPEDVAAGKPEMLLEIARRDGRVEDESWRVRKDGTKFWADVVISAARDASGQLLGFVKVTRDLTRRRAAEEQLRQSEERLRFMIDSVKDYAIFLLGPDGTVTSWNAGAERLKGWRTDEILGKPFTRFYTSEDIALGKPAFELSQAAELGRYEEEGWRVRKDGSRFWANVVISAVREGGRLYGFAKITRDMTERRRTEQELAARARQQAVIAALGQLALEAQDVGSVLARALETVCETLAVTGAVVLEGGDGGRASVRSARGVPAALASALASFGLAGGPLVLGFGDERLAALPGRQVRSLAAVPISAPHAHAGSLVVVSTAPRAFSREEVHFLEAVASILATAASRKEAETKRREAEQRAEADRMALKERDEFISVAAHELRTPLTALKLKLNGAERAVRREVPEDRVERLAQRVQGALRQADRLNELVGRLLDVSRVTAGQLRLACERIDLGEVAAHVVEDFAEESLASRAPISLRVEGDATGSWDRTRLEQVLLNLLSNALKYGPGAPIEVVVDGHAAEEVHLEVRDRGIGIAHADRERIFGRFERAVPIRHYGGLGLGLYITQHIVGAHGGTIDVDSEPGAGATFHIRLPRRARAEES
ncbi:MAG TPA: PAS domain S-box protein, partial [Thermoanaerobaculia bacterium]|nr:PAS domain S-box protein [Thermoanaerobaculia bacterium]